MPQKRLEGPWHRKADGLWHRYVDGQTMAPGVDVPPVTSTWDGNLLYGSCDDGFFDALNVKCDGKLRVRRFYENNFPSTPGSQEIKDFNRGVIPMVSFSNTAGGIINGSQDATLASYFGNSTQKKLVTWLHEPDAGYKAVSGLGGKAGPADFKLAQKRIHDIKVANCPNNNEVLFGPILMGFAFTKPQAPTAGYFRDYLIPADMDFVGSDPYRFWRPRYSPTIGVLSPPSPKTGNLGVKRSLAYLLGDLPSWAATYGLPLTIGEYSAHPDPEFPLDRAAWFDECDAFFKDTNHIAVAYYNTVFGEDGPWWVDRFHTFDPDMIVRRNGPDDPNSLNKFKSFL